MGLAVEHKAFTVHNNIGVCVQTALVSVEPLDIFQLGVFIELIEKAIAEAAGGENGNPEGDICPFRYCRP